MKKIAPFAFIVLVIACMAVFSATTMTNGGIVYKAFATHPDVPPSGGLLMWAKTDGTMQLTNSSAVDSGMGGGGGGAGPAVSAYMSGTSPTFVSAVPTPVPYNNNEFDTGGIHSTTVNNTRFVAPSAGYYLATASWQYAAGGQGNGSFRINGSTAVIGSLGSIPASYVQYPIVAVIHLAANDYVEFVVNVTSADSAVYTFDTDPKVAARMQLVKLF